MAIHATVIGAVGQDAKIVGEGSKARLTFSIGTTIGYGDRKKTLWINTTKFGKTGEGLASLLKKGTKVAAMGNLETYEDGNGKTHLNLLLDNIEIIGQSHKKPVDGTKEEVLKPAEKVEDNPFDDEIPF